jgi:YidC/Oxa1 family membrane protein insertase
MTLFFGYFTLQVPAGLSLYWVASNLLQIGQQWAVTRYLLPKSSVAVAAVSGAEVTASDALPAKPASASSPAKRVKAKRK